MNHNGLGIYKLPTTRDSWHDEKGLLVWPLSVDSTNVDIAKKQKVKYTFCNSQTINSTYRSDHSEA